jgi:hypothetical protein
LWHFICVTLLAKASVPPVPAAATPVPVSTFASDLGDVECLNKTWVPLAIHAHDESGLLVTKAADAVICEGARKRASPDVGLRVGDSVVEADKKTIFVVVAIAVPAKGGAVVALLDPREGTVCTQSAWCVTRMEVPAMLSPSLSARLASLS